MHAKPERGGWLMSAVCTLSLMSRVLGFGQSVLAIWRVLGPMSDCSQATITNAMQLSLASTWSNSKSPLVYIGIPQ
jgi:hypothetical protein